MVSEERECEFYKDSTFMETKMKSKRQQLLYDHYKTVFGEEPVFSLKLKKDVLPSDMKPITTFVFKPTEEMPFWKLCTIGASDYLMPERDIGWGRKANRRNEYMMLIAPDVEVSEDSTEWLFLNSLLWSTAEYAFNEKDTITVSDTIDMDIKGKYCGVVLLLPEVFKTPSVVKCYYTKHKYISIFQVMPIISKIDASKVVLQIVENLENDDYSFTCQTETIAIKKKPC